MSHPLLEQLHDHLGYARLDRAGVDAFIAAQPYSVLFFTEDPARFPEALDVAVILPELIKAFPQLTPALIERRDERALQGRYNFSTWPSLVFLKQGRYLGTLSRVHSWEDYQREIAALLAREPQRDPGIGIPVMAIGGQQGCAH